MRLLIRIGGAVALLLVVLAAGSMCLAVFTLVSRTHAPGLLNTHYPEPATSQFLQQVAPHYGYWQPLSAPMIGLFALAGMGVFLVGLVLGLLAALRFLAGGQRKLRRDPEQLNETVMIQEIHAGLSRMEDRVEALETILFDRAAPSPSGHGRSNAGRTV